MPNLSIAIFILVLHMPLPDLIAQDNDVAAVRAQRGVPYPADKKVGYLNSINVKAVRHFKKHYEHATKEAWSIGDDCLRVSFMLDDVKHIIDYGRNGAWRNTLRIFSEKELDPEIRMAIKSTFIDHNILTVTELRYAKTTAYFVKLVNEKVCKTVRIVDLGMEVIEEFVLLE